MAKTKLGILDGFNGKLGTVVGYERMNKELMRAYVKDVRNPRTEDQQAVRAKFGLLGKVCRTMLPALRLGMTAAGKAKQMTAGNLFMQKNWGAVSGATAAEVAVSYADLMLSTGQLPMPGFGAADFEEELTVKVTFEANSDVPGADASDEVYLFVYQPDTNGGVLGAPVLRSTQTVSVTVPASWSGMRVHVYGFAVGSAYGMTGKPSESAYVGSGNIG